MLIMIHELYLVGVCTEKQIMVSLMISIISTPLYVSSINFVIPHASETSGAR